MKECFKAVPVTDRVYWVGAIDWNIRDFHGYSTHRGTTYNAFLILADRITLVDAVKRPFLEELMGRIASVIDPARIDTIVSNHSELDHTGCLPEVIQRVNPSRVIVSAMGAKALREHFDEPLPLETVADGARVDLGGLHLTLLETRMLHWPDSMVAYLEEEQLLFSQDAFGMHLASSQRFDDELDETVLSYEAAKYYANILLPYSQLVVKQLDRLVKLNLPFRMIAPDHGPVWRADPGRIVRLYAHWAEQKPTRKAVIAYDTMWGSTDLMARAISDGLNAGGVPTRLMHLGGSHRSDVATELLEAGALLVGTPTLNVNMFPTVADLMVYLRGLKPKNLLAAAFGSYGWACRGVPQVLDMIREMGLEIVGEGPTVVYVPNAGDLERCYNYGLEVARALAARLSPPET